MDTWSDRGQQPPATREPVSGFTSVHVVIRGKDCQGFCLFSSDRLLDATFYLIVILICTYLITSRVEHLSTRPSTICAGSFGFLFRSFVGFAFFFLFNFGESCSLSQ